MPKIIRYPKDRPPYWLPVRPLVPPPAEVAAETPKANQERMLQRQFDFLAGNDDPRPAAADELK